MNQPVTRDQIVRHIRGQIVAGELLPGAQLPPRSELERGYGTTVTTVQRAFDVLVREGFVEVRRKRTFVATAPPHLIRYGLVYPDYESDYAQGSSFWRGLAAAAEGFAIPGSREMPRYYGIGRPEGQSDSDRLVQDVSTNRLAGLIFTTPPFWHQGERLLETPGVARVVIGAAGNLPVVNLEGFWEVAVQVLASRGHADVATVRANGVPWTEVETALKLGRLKTQPFWNQELALDHPSAGVQLVNLLMRCPPRPSSLIVGDDNFVDAALAGLKLSPAASELEVIAHCNFPALPLRRQGVTRVGYDLTDVLSRCIACLDAQRRGEVVANLEVVRPVVEGG